MPPTETKTGPQKNPTTTDTETKCPIGKNGVTCCEKCTYQLKPFTDLKDVCRQTVNDKLTSLTTAKTSVTTTVTEAWTNARVKLGEHWGKLQSLGFVTGGAWLLSFTVVAIACIVALLLVVWVVAFVILPLVLPCWTKDLESYETDKAKVAANRARHETCRFGTKVLGMVMVVAIIAATVIGTVALGAFGAVAGAASVSLVGNGGVQAIGHGGVPTTAIARTVGTIEIEIEPEMDNTANPTKPARQQPKPARQQQQQPKPARQQQPKPQPTKPTPTKPERQQQQYKPKQQQQHKQPSKQEQRMKERKKERKKQREKEKEKREKRKRMFPTYHAASTNAK